MIARFADTSYYVALINPRDEFHAQAVEHSRQFRGSIVTTQFVLVELGNWLSRVGDRAIYVAAVENIQSDRHTLIEPATSELFQRGLELYVQRADKDWSMTDCISLVVMTEQGLIEALSADHHFEQAGFKILLK